MIAPGFLSAGQPVWVYDAVKTTVALATARSAKARMRNLQSLVMFVVDVERSDLSVITGDVTFLSVITF